ncbi:O-antigen ligase [hydrothermal vent metagenome]|uniref:O-antigen ligase n=1 Tax=hydrothermal vent metagenome TaxID=652676 RepID=A0A1W1EHD0_9ZZZZ
MIKNIKIDNILNYMIVMYAFLIPLSRAGIAIFSTSLLLVWFFSNDFKLKIKYLIDNKITIYLIIFFILSFISIAWSDDISGGLYYFRKYLYIIPLFIIASTLQSRYIPYIISAFLSGMFVSEMFSYGIFFEIFQYKNILPSNPTPFMHHIPYSMFLAFTSLLILNRIFFAKRINIKIVLSFYFLTVLINLFINSGRTGQVAFILTLFIIFFLNIKNRVIALFSVTIFIITILYISYNSSPIFKSRVDTALVESKKILKDDYCTSWGRRAGGWIVAKDIFIDNPIIGTGLSYDMVYLKRYIDKNPNIFNNYKQNSQCVRTLYHYHNYYIQTAVRLGLVGFIIFILIFYYIIKLDIKDREIKNILIIFISVFMVSNLFDNLFHSQFGESLFALFIGLFMAQNRIEKGLDNK